MIRSTLKTDTATLQGQIDFLEDYEDFAYGVFEDVADEIKTDFLDELQTEPGKPQYPIQWTSEKQRKFVMAKLRRENNLPYRRTGKLKNAWVIEATRNGNTFALVVENPASAAPFVYGSLAKNRTSALRFQQQFHANTGWQPAIDTVQFWQQAFTERYAEDLELRTQDVFRTRAFTKTPKRTR